jgi:hypothetical protein
MFSVFIYIDCDLHDPAENKKVGVEIKYKHGLVE